MKEPLFDLSKLPNHIFVAQEGTPAKLKIPLTARPCPEIKWLKGEEDLEENERIALANTQISTTLSIKIVERDDAGMD